MLCWRVVRTCHIGTERRRQFLSGDAAPRARDDINRHRRMSSVPSDQAAHGDRMHCGIETGIQAQQGRSEHRGGLANRSSQTTHEGANGPGQSRKRADCGQQPGRRDATVAQSPITQLT